VRALRVRLLRRHASPAALRVLKDTGPKPGLTDRRADFIRTNPDRIVADPNASLDNPNGSDCGQPLQHVLHTRLRLGAVHIGDHQVHFLRRSGTRVIRVLVLHE